MPFTFWVIVVLACIAAIEALIIKVFYDKNRRLKADYASKQKELSSVRADAVRAMDTLVRINNIRGEANEKRRKIDATDNSELASMLNGILSDNKVHTASDNAGTSPALDPRD